MAVCDEQDLLRTEVITASEQHLRLWEGTPLTFLIGGTLHGLVLDPTCRPSLPESSASQPQGLTLTLKFQRQILQRALHAYVCDLQASGVDLVAYGLRERELLHDDISGWQGNFDADSMFMTSDDAHKNDLRTLVHFLVPIRLLDLEFGAEPGQWKLVWEPELEAVAREFWNMIERSPVLMPGSWVE